jgi:hypothetical protein
MIIVSIYFLYAAICSASVVISLFSVLLVDLVSYDANVKKIIDLFSSSDGAITQDIITLWKVTFTGRRKQFADCVLSTVVQEVVKNVCPLLQFQPFVS